MNRKEKSISLFEQFCSARAYSREETRQLDNMKTYMQSGNYLGPESLDEYVLVSAGDKADTNNLIQQFYGYCLANGLKVEDMPAHSFTDSTLLRRLEIAKYLHEPHKLSEIMERFSISDDTARADLAALEKGITFENAMIRIQAEKGDGAWEKQYRSTMHPVFLPLNLSEVWLLTNGLVQNTEHTLLREEYRAIANRIFWQLSGYGQRWILATAPEGTYPENPGNRFVREEDAAAPSHIRALLRVMKWGDNRLRCNIRYLENGAEKELRNACFRCSSPDTVLCIGENGEETEIHLADVLDCMTSETKKPR